MENWIRNFIVNSNLYGKCGAGKKQQKQKQNTINRNAVGEQFRTCIEQSNRWIRTEKSLETESEKIRLKITMTMTTTTTTLSRSERNESKRMKYRKKRTYTALHCVRYVCEWVTDWMDGREARAREREREARRRWRGRDILTHIRIHCVCVCALTHSHTCTHTCTFILSAGRVLN